MKGISVLFPGAGTLRGVFTTTDADGKRTFDAEGWEAAIQQVLAACKEFNVPCGYPATEADIETRMKQGFSVFIMGWGERRVPRDRHRPQARAASRERRSRMPRGGGARAEQRLKLTLCARAEAAFQPSGRLVAATELRRRPPGVPHAERG